MPRSITLILAAILCVSVSSLAGCGRGNSQGGDNKKIVAKINKYDLTVEDFKYESQGMPAGLSEDDFQKLKESLLDGIITKKILIQEAQAQNFDKDKAFIKEIERYWEQALLKALYAKKSQEILRNIESEEAASAEGIDKEATDKKVRDRLGVWIEGLRSRADIKRYPENLKEIKQD